MMQLDENSLGAEIGINSTYIMDDQNRFLLDREPFLI